MAPAAGSAARAPCGRTSTGAPIPPEPLSIGGGSSRTSAPEPATGFTLYTDTILRTLPEPSPRRRLFVPFEAERTRARALREEGWITVAALQPAFDWHEEARRLGCGHVLDGGEVRQVTRKGAEAGV